MKTREQIIVEMCYTYRHDFGLNRSEDDPPWVAGLTDSERKGLIKTMEQIFDNNIAPHMEFKDDLS